MARKRTITQAPTYGFGVRWIAQNDETSEHDPDVIAGFLSTLLLADLYGADPRSVAVDILRTRHGAGRWGLKLEEPCFCRCAAR